MKNIKNRVLSCILATVFAAGMFVIPNSFSKSADIAASAADTAQTEQKQLSISGIDELKIIDMGPPKSKSIEKNYSSITIEWETVQNADRYLIYIKEQNESDYKLDCVTSKTNRKISGLTPNTVYNIKVTPVKVTEESKSKSKLIPEAKGRSTVFKVNTKKYSDSVQNISYSVSDMTRPKYEKKDGRTKITESRANITITWDKVSGADTYQVVFQEGYSECIQLTDFSEKNGKITAVIPSPCGKKIKCTIYPCLYLNGEFYRGKGKAFNISIDAPKLTCVDLSNHGFVSCGNNTYYDNSGHSLATVQIFTALAMDSYGYSFTFIPEESTNNYQVYDAYYNSTKAGKLIFDGRSSKVKVILQNANKNVF
ncbi:MAG: fibronectin type III domain-containing protein [Oscillospiraceae bacterium]